MSEKKQMIPPVMLMFFVSTNIGSMTLIISFVTHTTGQDTWIVVIASLLLTPPFVLIYLKLMRTYPGESLISINERVFGRIIGKLISVIYISFYFTLALLNTDIIADFVGGMILPETPRAAIIILFISLCAYAVYKGIEPVIRCGGLFSIVLIIVVIINGILLIKNMKPSNLLPVFSFPVKKYIQAIHIEVTVPFLGPLSTILMLGPSLKEPKNIIKPVFSGFLIGGVVMLIAVLREALVLGKLLPLLANPSFESIRMIAIADSLSRFEIVYATVLLSLSFHFVSNLFYCAAKATEEVLGLNSYREIVKVGGVLIIIFALIGFSSAIDHAYWGVNYSGFYSTFFEIILPIVTLLVSGIKRYVQRKRGGKT